MIRTQHTFFLFMRWLSAKSLFQSERSKWLDWRTGIVYNSRVRAQNSVEKIVQRALSNYIWAETVENGMDLSELEANWTWRTKLQNLGEKKTKLKKT